jgi:16S rRNA C1402 N4-methylase RsmH
MKEEKEVQEITKLFLNLGAEEKMATQMAKQLLKRAEQRSEKEKITKTMALEELLEVAIYGAQGRLKPSDEANFANKKA